MFELILSIISLFILVLTTCAKKKKVEDKPSSAYTPPISPQPILVKSPEVIPAIKVEPEKKNVPVVDEPVQHPCIIRMMIIGTGNAYPDFITGEFEDMCNGKLIKMDGDIASRFHDDSTIYSVVDFSILSDASVEKVPSNENPMMDWDKHPPHLRHGEQDTEVDDDTTKTKTQARKEKTPITKPDDLTDKSGLQPVAVAENKTPVGKTPRRADTQPMSKEKKTNPNVNNNQMKKAEKSKEIEKRSVRNTPDEISIITNSYYNEVRNEYMKNFIKRQQKGRKERSYTEEDGWRIETSGYSESKARDAKNKKK